MQTKKLTALTTSALLLGASQTVIADEYLWVYAQGADTLPEGALELKLSNISRIDKNDSGHYRFNEIRPEIEYGVTNKLTLKGEVLIFDHDYAIEDPEINPMYETQGGEGGSFDDTQYAGYELGFKYNVLSPYIDPIGFAVGASYEHRDKYRLDGSDIDQDSFVLTTYFQKNWMDDTVIVALTPKVEFERRRGPGVLEEEIAFDVAAGIAYRFMPKWYVGLEFRHQSDYLNPEEDGDFDPEYDQSEFDLTDWQLGSQYQHGNYLGPTLHYAEKEWWVTTGILWQIEGDCTQGCQPGAKKNGRNWDEHERIHVGLTFGYEFDV